MKRKRGRPSLPKKKARGILVAVRMSPEEVRTVRAAIHQARARSSDWLRAAILAAAQNARSGASPDANIPDQTQTNG